MKNLLSLNRKLVFGINDTIPNSLHCIDDDLLCYIGGNNCIILHDLQESKQNFLCDTDDIFQKITAIATSKNKKRSSDLLVLAALDLHQHCTVILFDYKHGQKLKDFECIDFTSSCHDFEVVSLSFNCDDKLIVALGVKDKRIWKVICWHVELERAIAESEELQINIDSLRLRSLPIGNVEFHSSISGRICVSLHQNIFYFDLQEFSNATSKPELSCELEVTINEDDGDQSIQCHCWVNNYTVFGTNKGRIILMNGILSKEFRVFHDTSLPDNATCSIDSLICSRSFNGFIAGCSRKTIQIYAACNGNNQTKSSSFSDVFQCIRSFPIEATHSVGDRDGRLSSLTLSLDEKTLFMEVNGENQLISINIGSLSPSMLKGGTNSSIIDLQNNLITKCINHGHIGRINSISICIRKPILITAGKDETVRVWDYNLGCLEICKFFHNEEPLSVALHPGGHHLLIGFSNKLQLMNILVDDLQIVRDFPITMCRECHFSKGGHAFAAAQSNVISVFNYHSGKKQIDFKGHNSKVRRIHWNYDDHSIISTEDDGPIYQWKVEDGERIGEFVSWTTTQGDTKCCSRTVMSGRHVFVIENRGIMQLSCENLEVISKVDCNISTLMGPVGVSYKEPCFMYMEQKNRICAIDPCTASMNEILQPGTAPTSFLSIAYQDNFLIACDSFGCISIFNIIKSKQFENQQTLITASKEESNVVQHFLQCDDVLIRESDLEEIDASLKELEGKMNEISMQHEYHVRMIEISHKEKVRDMKEIFTKSLQEQDLKFQILEEETQIMRSQHKEQIQKLQDRLENEVQSIELENQKILLNEVASYQKSIRDWDLEKRKLSDQRKELFQKHKKEEKDKQHSLREKLGRHYIFYLVLNK